MHVGQEIVYARMFTAEDVEEFARVSGDTGQHHIAPDALGHIMVHGLLTATLPTKVGGDLNFIARNINFVFERPVYAGDTVTCLVTLTQVEPADGLTRVTAEFICRNQNDKTVMTGITHGIVRSSNIPA